MFHIALTVGYNLAHLLGPSVYNNDVEDMECFFNATRIINVLTLHRWTCLSDFREESSFSCPGALNGKPLQLCKHFIG